LLKPLSKTFSANNKRFNFKSNHVHLFGGNMGRGDFGFDGLYSLQAVNSWIGVINANLNASNRTGYKTVKTKFKGGVAYVDRRPYGPLLGIQTPETTLQVDHTSIDFSQGSIIGSTEPTHLAIQGQGFFALAVTLGGPAFYYSRDGEFHVMNVAALNAPPDLRLVHSTGLYLTIPAGAVIVFDAENDLVRLNNLAGPVFNEQHLQGFAAPNFLRFSRFGSTVFETTGNAADAGPYVVSQGAARVVPAALESSNSSLSQTLPELSLAQKFFSAVSKVISVHQTNLDTVINLIR